MEKTQPTVAIIDWLQHDTFDSGKNNTMVWRFAILFCYAGYDEIIGSHKWNFITFFGSMKRPIGIGISYIVRSNYQ